VLDLTKEMISVYHDPIALVSETVVDQRLRQAPRLKLV